MGKNKLEQYEFNKKLVTILYTGYRSQRKSNHTTYQQLLEKPDKEYPLVEFENFEMTVFFFGERFAITSVATGIRIV